MAEVQEQVKEKPVSEKREKYIVAALDFGTTYSGYAYSFKHDFKKDPTQHIGKALFHKVSIQDRLQARRMNRLEARLSKIIYLIAIDSKD